MATFNTTNWGSGSTPKESIPYIKESLDALHEGVLTAVPAVVKDYVDTANAALITGAPALLDTIYELANAINNDPNYAATTIAMIGTKAPLANPVFGGNVNIQTGSLQMGSWDIAHWQDVKVKIGGILGGQFTQLGLYTNGTERVSVDADGVSVVGKVTATDLVNSSFAPKDNPVFTGAGRFNDSGVLTDTYLYCNATSDYAAIGGYQNGVGGKALVLNSAGGYIGAGGVTDPKATWHSTGSTAFGVSGMNGGAANINNMELNIAYDPYSKVLYFQAKGDTGVLSTGTMQLT